MEQIRWISLKNSGAVIVHIRVTGPHGDYTFSERITAGEDYQADLSKTGGKIKEGDTVRLLADVAGSTRDNEAKEAFVYSKSSNKKAHYTLKGTAGLTKMTFDGVSDAYSLFTIPIRGIRLHNKGAFTARIRVMGDDIDFNDSKDITAGTKRFVDLAAFNKFKEDERIRLKVLVSGGHDNTAAEYLIYRKSAHFILNYEITGSTLNNKLNKAGVESFFVQRPEQLRFLTLENKGAFVARIRIKKGTSDYEVLKDIPVGQSLRIDLANYDSLIGNGQRIQLEAYVSGGTDNLAAECFEYQKSGRMNAVYQISGTTLDNTLTLKSVYAMPLPGPALDAATRESLEQQLDEWERDGSTRSAWRDITKAQVVKGLKAILGYHFDFIEKKTPIEELGNPASEECLSGIDQGADFPICGPVAAMFLFQHYDIRAFVPAIIKLYEKGDLLGHPVPSALREASCNIGPTYRCHGGAAEVCWMFQASLAQQKTPLTVKPEPNSVTMGAFLTKEKSYIKLLFNAHDIKRQTYTGFGIASKALENLKEWQSYLADSGAIIWNMHGTALENLRDGTDNHYLRSGRLDLHLVPVINVHQITADDVTLDVASWGHLWRIKVKHEEFRKMTVTALLFKYD